MQETLQLTIDRSASGAVYKGIAMGSNGPLLFEANFSAGTVEVFDGNYQPAAVPEHVYVVKPCIL